MVRRLAAAWLSLVGAYDRFLARHPAANPALDGVLLAALTWVHRLFALPFHYAYMANDERYFLWEGWSITRGLVPYRDFQEFKPPMIFLVNAAALETFGLDGLRFRWFLWLLSLAGFLALAIALRNRGVSRWLLVGTFPFLYSLFFDGHLHDSGINDAESVAIPFYFLGVALLLARGRWYRLRLVAGGACFALVPLSKEPLAFMILATWAALLSLDLVELPEARAIPTFVAYTALGVASVLVVWLGYMLVTHSLGDYLVQLRQTMDYTSHYAGMLGRRPEIPWAGDPSTTAHFLAVGILSLTGLAFTGRARWLVLLSTVAATLASFFAVTVGGAYWRHYFVMALPGVYLSAVIGILFFSQAVRQKEGAGFFLSLAWVMAAAVVFLRPLLRQQSFVSYYVEPPPPVSAELVSSIAALSVESDCIWTLGDPLLYVYGNRCNAVKEGVVLDELISLYPGVTDEERLAGERRELEAHPPKLVIFGDDEAAGYRRKKRYIDALAMPFLEAHGYVAASERIYVRPD